MQGYHYVIIALLSLLLLVLAASFVCFMIVFYSPRRRVLREDEFQYPKGEIYLPYRERMTQWMRDLRSMPHEDVSILSEDGLTLRGRYYEHRAGAPIELMFHGYQGNAERDLCGGVWRCFALGHNALIIDHRASGTSDGHVITFGIREHRDCLRWIDFAIAHFGPDVKLMITGISMGAATVMMAAGRDLPRNVVAVLADCGYTSPREIICKVLRDLHLPVFLFYPLIKLGARLYGRFDLEEWSPLDAMRRCRVPVIFFHGTSDDYVPYEMSCRLYEICTAEKKRLVTVPGAGHGLAFSVDEDTYLHHLGSFAEECGFYQ